MRMTWEKKTRPPQVTIPKVFRQGSLKSIHMLFFPFFFFFFSRFYQVQRPETRGQIEMIVGLIISGLRRCRGVGPGFDIGSVQPGGRQAAQFCQPVPPPPPPPSPSPIQYVENTSEMEIILLAISLLRASIINPTGLYIDLKIRRERKEKRRKQDRLLCPLQKVTVGTHFF